MIPSLHFLISPVVYPKVPYLPTLCTTLDSVILKNSLKYHLYADDTQMYISFTPTNSALSLETTLSLIFFPEWTWTNCSSIHLKLNFFLYGTKQQCLKFSDLTLISQQWYHPSQFLCLQSWLHLWLWHVFLWSDQLSVQILFIYLFIYSFLINTPKLHYRSDGLKHVQCYDRHRKAYIKMKRLHLTNFTK